MAEGNIYLAAGFILAVAVIIYVALYFSGSARVKEMRKELYAKEAELEKLKEELKAGSAKIKKMAEGEETIKGKK